MRDSAAWRDVVRLSRTAIFTLMKATDPTYHPEPAFYKVSLHPNCSLGSAGFLAVMLAFGAVSFIAGMFFLMHGAWPVFGFFGLDVALLYFALRMNYRAASRIETIEISGGELKVTATAPNRQSSQHCFDPYWVRVELQKIRDHVGALHLRSHGRRLEIAAFLGPEERAQFAENLQAALSDYRTQT